MNQLNKASKRSTIKQLQKSSEMIVNNDIVPCSKYFCVCVEYLNFASKSDGERYKQCFNTDSKWDVPESQFGMPLNKDDIIHKPYIQEITQINKTYI